VSASTTLSISIAITNHLPEVYVPPYLTDGSVRPVMTVAADQKDWAYGGTYTVTIDSSTFAPSAGRFSLLTADASTHGNNMGARTLFPAFTCNGNTCTITAPPNSHVSPPAWHKLYFVDGKKTPSHGVYVRIGGDPGNTGSWPQDPKFIVPGPGPYTG